MADLVPAVEPAGRLTIAGDATAHVLRRVRDAVLQTTPFAHLYIEQIFPDGLYAALRGHMLAAKHGAATADRLQDNPAFVNKRFSLAASDAPVVRQVRSIFGNPQVKRALLARFFREAPSELVDRLEIHEEFEFLFTKAGRFQNIHVDIPPKFLSFVFYIPEHPMQTAREEEENATILYDGELEPQYCARFRSNSVCIFAPHFQSYHGFHSTRDRDVLVMFYVDPPELLSWRKLSLAVEKPPFDGVRDAIERKLRRYPLIEYAAGEEALTAARRACRINGPQGRVLAPG